MPKPSKVAVEKKPVQPTVPAERLKMMLVQVCGYRIVLQEQLEYVRELSPDLVEELEMCLGAEEGLERKLATEAVRANPRIELPNVCIYC